MSKINDLLEDLLDDKTMTKQEKSKTKQLLSKCRMKIVFQWDGLKKYARRYYCLISFILVCGATLCCSLKIYCDIKKEEKRIKDEKSLKTNNYNNISMLLDSITANQKKLSLIIKEYNQNTLEYTKEQSKLQIQLTKAALAEKEKLYEINREEQNVSIQINNLQLVVSPKDSLNNKLLPNK